MRSGVKVFAWKAIRHDQEITIDYRLNAFTGEHCECDCGASDCEGSYELSYFAMTAGRQRSLLPYAPTFIQKEYRRRARELEPRS